MKPFSPLSCITCCSLFPPVSVSLFVDDERFRQCAGKDTITSAPIHHWISLAPGSAPASPSPLSSSSCRGRVRCLVSPWKLTVFFRLLRPELLGLERRGGGGRVSSAASPLPACPTVGMGAEMGPDSGTGIGMPGFRAMSLPRAALSAACKVGSG